MEQNVEYKWAGMAKLRAGVDVNAESCRISQKGLAYFCRNSRLAAGRVEALFCLDFLLTFSSWKK